MPLVYRSMLKDGDGPQVGSGDNMLGVRIPPHKRPDVKPDNDGMVHPDQGGMSVNGNWMEMHLNHIPARFKHLVPKARGNNNKSIWQHGKGPFESSPISAQLKLRLDNPRHGLVEPIDVTSLENFQDCLAATRTEWREIDA